MLSDITYPVRTPEEVTIYLEDEDIPGDFEKIAILNASGATQWSTLNQMYRALKNKAALIGANGILVLKVNEPSAGAKIAAEMSKTVTFRKAEMLAILVFSE